MYRRLIPGFAFLLLWTAASGAYAQDCVFKTQADESLRQALKNFHDAMSQLIHGPAEQGDFAPVKAKAGELAALRDGIMAANLPEKLARRCADISAKAGELSKAVDDLAAQARRNAGDEAMKTALDAVHTAYRNLNSAQTTLDDLLEAFHDVMHPLWHDAYPDKDAAAIKKEIPKLKVRAKLILSTAENAEKGRTAGARSLLEAVTTLEEAAAAQDDMAVLEALRIVHDAYEKLAEGHD
ncbi:MAG: hypothetical protein ABIG68_12660 [Acidobacteriota bacterium]